MVFARYNLYVWGRLVPVFVTLKLYIYRYQFNRLSCALTWWQRMNFNENQENEVIKIVMFAIQVYLLYLNL